MKRIAVTLGDRYGVGPELVARRLTEAPPPGTRFVVLGDPEVLARGARSARVELGLAEVASPEAAEGDACLAPLRQDLPLEPLGRVDGGSGREMLAVWDQAIGWIRQGVIDGLVYAPLSKQAMALAGHAEGDELEFLNRALRPTAPTGEINVLGPLWTSRVTSHLPIARVAEGITQTSVAAAIRLVHDAQARAGIAPRIGVAALNPHAGEGGLYGTEEIETLTPCVAELREQGLEVQGPFPSDTIFPRANREGLTAVVTMYHDQGQIALKLLGLGQGVTLLAGFAVPIATPGHGTAYDIAGQGTARGDGLSAAIDLVARLA